MSSDPVQEQQNEQPRKKGRGCLLTSALAIFLALAVPVVGGLLLSMRAASRVDDELDEIRAAGEPATARELNDYYERPPADEDATQLWLRAAKPFDYCSFDNEQYVEDCGELPIVGYSEEDKTIPPPGEDWEELVAAEEFLAKYADDLRLLHEAADKGSAARYPLDFSKGWLALMPHTSGLRGCARMLALQAHVRAHRGDARGAAESIRAIFALERSLEKEPTLISQLVRLSAQDIACERIGQLLPHVEFSDEDLSSLRAELKAVDHDAALERAIIGERATGVTLLRNPASVDETKDPAAARLAARNDDLLLYLKVMNDYLAAARRPLPQRLDDLQAVEDRLLSISASLSKTTKLRYILSLLSLPSCKMAAEAFARSEATTRAADAALALEQFRRKNGRLPEKLDELVPELLEEIPLDPFDGKPLRYSVRDDAYVIYSIGRDRADDGGKILAATDEDGYEIENPDVIFPVTRAKQ